MGAVAVGTPAHACPRLFCAEVDHAGRLNEQLGLGIAAFQGLSNLALNGQWGHQVGPGGLRGVTPLGRTSSVSACPLLHVPFK